MARPYGHQAHTWLAGRGPRPYAATMFVVTEAEAEAIRTAFNRRGELSAAIELRRLFPGITDTAKARECARTIAGWRPVPPGPLPRGKRPPPETR
jgi:hypothetical protein